jgi:RNA polymerase sigma-70 factor (ECF subfamily)
MPLTDPSEDLALLIDMRGGNAAAFETLYRRHQAALFRFALLRCGSPDTAADIVQEIFMGLLSNALKFDPARGVLLAFLFGVARNLLLKREAAHPRLASRPTPAPGATLDLEDTIVDPAPPPVQRLLDQERDETVRRALLRLAPHYRDVVILYEMHDRSYVEIAQICNIDIGTVRSRLSRARARLVEMLRPDFPEATTPAKRETPAHQLESRP